MYIKKNLIGTEKKIEYIQPKAEDDIKQNLKELFDNTIYKEILFLTFR